MDRSHPLSDTTMGVLMYMMNELGIDYATIGNNEGIGLAKNRLDCIFMSKLIFNLSRISRIGETAYRPKPILSTKLK